MFDLIGFKEESGSNHFLNCDHFTAVWKRVCVKARRGIIQHYSTCINMINLEAVKFDSFKFRSGR